MKKQDFKVIVRYLIITFFMYLAWDITRPEYLNDIKNIGELPLSSVFASIFGVLGWVVKSNWSSNPSKE